MGEIWKYFCELLDSRNEIDCQVSGVLDIGFEDSREGEGDLNGDFEGSSLGTLEANGGQVFSQVGYQRPILGDRNERVAPVSAYVSQRNHP